ncbi:MAG: flagellin [Acetobacter papayae]|uniref:flagellin N-terminal helical domain-containing protein n=1 Tax=Acetobacter papayae TaxID=1076592 RepID=UPI0039ED3108
MSLSINTNASALVAIETLDATQTELSNTENEVSTGNKVNNASDNAAAYSISQQLSGQSSGLSAVNSGLTFAAQVVSTATTAVSSILTDLKSIQSLISTLTDNSSSSSSTSDTSDSITQELNAINVIARNATLSGVNLLVSSASDGVGIQGTSLTYLTSLGGDTNTVTGLYSDASADAAASATSISAGLTGFSGTSLTDALGLTQGVNAQDTATANVFTTADGTALNTTNFDGTTGGSSTAQQMVALIEQAITAMTSIASKLGSNTSIISSMSSFGTTLSDNITQGIGALVDADMSAASAQLTSLQTKQSLAIKSLTIANTQSQSILSLFQ